MPRPLIYLLYVLITSAVFLAGRILYIVFNKNGNVLNNKSRVAKTLVVLGSGGHTTEILQIIKNLNLEQYTPRLYVHAHSDKISAIKVYEFENERQDFNIVTISRSREVGQSYFTSIWTTLVSFQDSLKIVWNFKPDLLLCNGPDTKMCIIAPITGAQIPWDIIDDNVQKNIPIEIKIPLLSMCNKLRFSCIRNEILPLDYVEDSLLRVEAWLDQTWEALNTGYWKNVPIQYRYCYTLCSAVKGILLEIQGTTSEGVTDIAKRERLINIIKQIDKALLLGAPLPNIPNLMTTMASKLNRVLAKFQLDVRQHEEIPTDDSEIRKEILPGFVWIPRFEAPPMETFYREIFKPKSPAVLEKCLQHWKALDAWKDINYLMKLAGHRTVPIEIGSRYTEEDWSQSLVTFAEFLQSHVFNKHDKVGYLAQHELFEQIPELKEDFSIPDYCTFSDGESEPTVPNINAWFGPCGTVSPLHFDPMNNLLCQVFGCKRIILYRPEESANLYSYETRLLFNTAQVDPINPNYEKWPRFKDAKGIMCYLKPGEMLFIPPGWWHHVESLTASFSISFWWH